MASPRQVKIKTSVKNGKLVLNRDLVKQAVKSYEGKNVSVTIENWFPRRTQAQNKYYWGVVVEHWKNIIETEWGELWSTDKTHDLLKTCLNYTEQLDEDSGNPVRAPKSTTNNTTADQENYHEACRQLAHQMFNYIIPLPDIGVVVKHK